MAKAIKAVPIRIAGANLPEGLVDEKADPDCEGRSEKAGNNHHCYNGEQDREDDEVFGFLLGGGHWLQFPFQ
jgi:hypothetical protein